MAGILIWMLARAGQTFPPWPCAMCHVPYALSLAPIFYIHHSPSPLSPPISAPRPLGHWHPHLHMHRVCHRLWWGGDMVHGNATLFRGKRRWENRPEVQVSASPFPSSFQRSHNTYPEQTAVCQPPPPTRPSGAPCPICLCHAPITCSPRDRTGQDRCTGHGPYGPMSCAPPPHAP